jgi:hypothetical protein
VSAPFQDYFRCPEHLDVFDVAPGPSPGAGYFRFGGGLCYGRTSAAPPSPRVNGALPELSGAVASRDGRIQLPFDLAEVVDNLRLERYALPTPAGIERLAASRLAHAAYYHVRPLLPVGVRKHLQRLRFGRWDRLAFPRWPVDTSVDTLMRGAARLLLQREETGEFPFIWFWPEGAPGCAMVTHDVEGPAGAAFAGRLMDLDARHGIPSAFQLVPEAKTSPALLAECRRREFEVNVHDLNHDGHLFTDRALFEARAAEINRYAREYGSRGFRSGAMYRRQDWFDALDVAYDMSVPNVAHLEPQRGGCCTVMPHFIGDVLELPLTLAQDYTLFHILGDYSGDLWRTQVARVLAHNGLASVIAHPDYLQEPRALEAYTRLLEEIVRLRSERNVWVAAPAEIDRWWRQRRAMRLVADGAGWRVEGEGSERARLAYGRLEDDATTCTLAAA